MSQDQERPPNKRCETCWHWKRLAHPLDFELGRCGLFEREMRAGDVCGMWEPPMGAVVTDDRIPG